MITWIIVTIILVLIIVGLIIDDIKQRQRLIQISQKYNKLFDLLENLSNYYQNMLNQMNRLDSTGVYDENDDMGQFFKYVRQSLKDIQHFFE